MHRAISATIAALFVAVFPIMALADVFNADEFMQTPGRKSLVLLMVQGQDTTGQAATNIGTAFFISPRGFALTAAHLFYSRRDPSDATQRLHAAGGQSLVAGRVGSAGAAPQLFNLVRISPDQDVALVQLLDPPEPTQFLKVCSSITPPLTEDLAAFGFTAAQSLTAVTGRRIGPLSEARYPTGININPGMSGGPIITSAGKVFGLALSGVREQQFQGYNFFLPLQFADELIRNSQVAEDCSPMAPVNSQISVASRTVSRPPLTIGERTVLFDGFTQYAQSSFNFHDRLVVGWGDLTGDIGVSNTQSREPRDPQASFFLPYDAPPYPDARKATGEIARAPIQDLRDADDCTSATGYAHHWFKPELQTTYCIKTRDGKGFAKITVRDIRPDRIYFDWIYQPTAL